MTAPRPSDPVFKSYTNVTWDDKPAVVKHEQLFNVPPGSPLNLRTKSHTVRTHNNMSALFSYLHICTAKRRRQVTPGFTKQKHDERERVSVSFPSPASPVGSSRFFTFLAIYSETDTFNVHNNYNGCVEGHVGRSTL